MEGVVFKTNHFVPHAVCKTELRRTLIFSQMVVKFLKSLSIYLTASVPEKTHVLFFSNLPQIAHKIRFKIVYFKSYAFLAITSEEIENWMMPTVVKFPDLVSHKEVHIDHPYSNYLQWNLQSSLHPIHLHCLSLQLFKSISNNCCMYSFFLF